MRENGIRGRHKRRYKATTDSKHSLPVAPNLLDRNFQPSAPNQTWTADPFEYIEAFYTQSRRHSTLGYTSPIRFLQDWIKTQHEQKMAA